MSLPAPWIDRIFSKLTVAYGRDFLSRWEGVSMNDVKSDWAHELSGFVNCPDAIAWALAHLPDGKPPTVMQFRALANSMPRQEHMALLGPAPSAEKLAKELSKMVSLQKAIKNTTVDHKEWARRLIARHEGGENLKPVVLRFAREALGISNSM